MRVILCGGGTAGHVTPALAVAEELKIRDKNNQILFIGREGGAENQSVIKSGIELKTLKIQGIIRSASIKNLNRVYMAIKARAEAKKIIKEYKPDVVLGTGGYVCWPVVSAAKKMHVPIALHESNVAPGLTTRLLAKQCDAVFLNHSESEKYLSRVVRYLTVGNPIKKEFYRLTREQARAFLGIKPDEFLIVSFGGSIGADKINDVMMELIKTYSTKEKNIKHIHATGERYYNKLPQCEKNYDRYGCQVTRYIDNMPTVLKAADIAICRSGAMTVSELCACGVCAILVPSPNVTDNHQYKNAKVLSDKKAATLIEEKNLSTDALIKVINQLKNDKNGRKKQAKTIKQFSTPRAAEVIVNNLILLKNGSF